MPRTGGMRMTWLARVVLVLACLGIASCDQQKLIDRFTPKAEAAVAKAAIDDLRHGNIDAVEAKLVPDEKDDPATDAKLRQLVAYFPSVDPVSMTTVGARINDVNGVRHVQLTYEYRFDKAWVVTEIALVKSGDRILIEGIHLNRNEQSLAGMNAFSLHGKGMACWLMAGLTFALPLFCIFVFVLCLRTPMRGRKWLWAVFTLLGVGTVHLVWTTGEFSISLLSVELLSASAMQMGSGPWTLGVSFPLGAVIFLARRRELMRRAAAATPPAIPGNERDSHDV